jgi:hypothetical protein
MANEVLSSTVFVVDTPGAAVISQKWWRPVAVRWFVATTPGHQAVVTDAAGHEIWHGVADDPPGTLQSHLDGMGPVHGLIVAMLGFQEQSPENLR